VCPTALDVPALSLGVGPDAFPCGRLAVVIRLKLVAVDHPEASARLRTEHRNEIAGLWHRVHGQTVDRGSIVEDSNVVEVHCAECGCLVDAGRVVERCGDPDCCCRDLPDKSRDAVQPA